MRGWFERWNRAKTEEIALMERLIQWLTDHLPVSPAPTLVHNDFKLDNLMLDSNNPGRDRSGARLGNGNGRRSAGGSRAHSLLLVAAERSGRHEAVAHVAARLVHAR